MAVHTTRTPITDEARMPLVRAVISRRPGLILLLVLLLPVAGWVRTLGAGCAAAVVLVFLLARITCAVKQIR